MSNNYGISSQVVCFEVGPVVNCEIYLLPGFFFFTLDNAQGNFTFKSLSFFKTKLEIPTKKNSFC